MYIYILKYIFLFTYLRTWIILINNQRNANISPYLVMWYDVANVLIIILNIQREQECSKTKYLYLTSESENCSPPFSKAICHYVLGVLICQALWYNNSIFRRIFWKIIRQKCSWYNSFNKYIYSYHPNYFVYMYN